MDKGQTLKASYVHSVDASNNTHVVAEMTHGLSTLDNSGNVVSTRMATEVVDNRFSIV
ncbi:hypothetical protein HanPI659440_Chr05g0191921 [Helianthus annuus]|nr:hypothetical protein HanPI659440_Chr05g0191921 [Helianthus annuus]